MWNKLELIFQWNKAFLLFSACYYKQIVMAFECTNTFVEMSYYSFVIYLLRFNHIWLMIIHYFQTKKLKLMNVPEKSFVEVNKVTICFMDDYLLIR